MSQVLSIPFTLSGAQTYAIIKYRPLGSTGPFSTVTPYPTSSPYDLTVPDGMWEVTVQPSCNQSYGTPKKVSFSLAGRVGAIDTPPYIYSAIERLPIIVDTVPCHVVDVSISIPYGTQVIEWYIDGLKVRESLNTNESFIIPDNTWALTQTVIGCVARYSSITASAMATATVPFIMANPDVFAVNPPTFNFTAITGSSFTFNMTMPIVGTGVTILQAKIEYRLRYFDPTWSEETFALTALPKTMSGLIANSIYEVRCYVQATDGVDTVWSAASAIQQVVTNDAQVLTVINILSTSAKCIWNDVALATGYRLVVKNIVTTSVTEIITPFLQYIITGLQPATHYDIYVIPVYAEDAVGIKSNTVDVLTQITDIEPVASANVDKIRIRYSDADSPDKKTYTNATLINKKILGAWRQIEQEVIDAGTPVINQLKYELALGKFSWHAPLADAVDDIPEESILIHYTDN